MKTLEELLQLRDELKAAYETVLNNPETKYDNATVVYAKKCLEDAEKALFDVIKPAYDLAASVGLSEDTIIVEIE